MIYRALSVDYLLVNLNCHGDRRVMLYKCYANIEQSFLSLNQTKARSLVDVRCDAYGLQASTIYSMLQDKADGFLVSSFEEATRLDNHARNQGQRKPIFVLHPHLTVFNIQLAQHNQWIVCVDSMAKLRTIVHALLSYTTKPLKVWLKLSTNIDDTGLIDKEVVSVLSLPCINVLGVYVVTEYPELASSALAKLPQNIDRTVFDINYPMSWVHMGVSIYTDAVQLVSSITYINQRNNFAHIDVGYLNGYPAYVKDATVFIPEVNQSLKVVKIYRDHTIIDIVGSNVVIDMCAVLIGHETNTLCSIAENSCTFLPKLLLDLTNNNTTQTCQNLPY